MPGPPQGVSAPRLSVNLEGTTGSAQPGTPLPWELLPLGQNPTFRADPKPDPKRPKISDVSDVD